MPAFPGRDFRLGLTLHDGTLLRIEVTDICGERHPLAPCSTAVPEANADDYAESGRGLLIVEALADRWGTAPGPPPRKTVWAELDLSRAVERPGARVPSTGKE